MVVPPRLLPEAKPKPSHTGKRYVEAMRPVLAALGAWPWSEFPDGRLPPRWWEQERVVWSLQRWHREAFVATHVALTRSGHALPANPTRADFDALAAVEAEAVEAWERLVGAEAPHAAARLLLV
jgi:hypothetical protein